MAVQNPVFHLPDEDISIILNIPCARNVLTLDEWFQASNTGFNVLHVNIRSIGKHWEEFLLIVGPKLNCLHVLVLSEVNIREDCVRLYCIPGFRRHSFTRREQRGGGLLVFVKDMFSSIQVPPPNFITTFELVHVSLSQNSVPVYSLLCIYRPPSSSEREFIQELESLLLTTNLTDKMIIIGDINICLQTTDPNRQRYADRLLDLTAGLGFMSGIDGYTREEVRDGVLTQSCIDLIFSRGHSENARTAIIKHKLADHYFITLNLPNVQTKQTIHKDKKIYNEQKLQQKLNNINWDNLLQINNPTTFYDVLTDYFNDIYKDCTMTIKQNRERKIWMNRELLAETKERDRLFQIYKNNPRHPEHAGRYKKCRNKLNKKIKRARDVFYRLEFERNRDDVSKTWGQINSLLGRKKCSVDETVARYLGQSATLPDQFAESFVEGIERVRHICDVQVCTAVPVVQDQSMFCVRANKETVARVIKNLKDDKAPGVDKIRARDLKHVVDSISEPLAHFINLSLSQGFIPSKLKQAIYRPIYKSGAHTDFSNYRPVALLNQLHKVMEKFFSPQLTKYLELNHVLADQQHGFRKRRSTDTLLAEFCDYINSELDSRRQVLVILVDFSKAFETLDFKMLINSLRQAGINGPFLNWCESYVNERSFVVKLGDSRSQRRVVTSGVPQGSVLGPQFYILYTNHLCHLLSSGTVKAYSYADDLALVVSRSSLDEAEQDLQSAVNKLVLWCHDHGLVVSDAKTKIMHIRSPQFSSRPVKITTHTLDCVHTSLAFDLPCHCPPNVEMVSSAKYLGVWLDHRFKWDVHVEYVCKRLRACAYSIFRLRKILSPTTLKSVYLALVESIVRYGLLVYGNASNTCLDYIETQQRIILRAMVGRRIDGDDPRKYFKHFQVLPVTDLYKFLFLTKYHEREDLKRTFQHPHDTRRDRIFIEPRYTNEYGKRTLKFLLPHFLNSIPAEWQTIRYTQKTKCKMKLFFLGLPTG